MAVSHFKQWLCVTTFSFGHTLEVIKPGPSASPSGLAAVALSANMQRGMSYRKPVPIYIPSPPASPVLLATQPPHSLENNPVSSQVDMQNVLQQPPMQGQDTIYTPNIAVNGIPLPGQVPALDKKVPSLLVKSPEGERIPINDSNYTPLTAPSYLPPSPGRRVKRKLHQDQPKQYRPPTPPLPSHTRKHRTPDTLPVAETPSSSIFNGNCESPYPELRRNPSTVAPSFTTYYTQSPSFQTEKTYISFGSSERYMFWSKKGNVGLHQCSKFDARRSLGRLSVVGHSTEADEEVSWWGRIGNWGALIGLKVKRFANMYMC